MELKGSQTEKNLLIAFAGESQARNRYTYYAAKPRRRGMSILPQFFSRPRKMRRSTPRYFLSIWGKAAPRSWPAIPFIWGTR